MVGRALRAHDARAMNMYYELELFTEQRVQERLAEAERERLAARAAAGRTPGAGRAWRTAITGLMWIVPRARRVRAGRARLARGST